MDLNYSRSRQGEVRPRIDYSSGLSHGITSMLVGDNFIDLKGGADAASSGTAVSRASGKAGRCIVFGNTSSSIQLGRTSDVLLGTAGFTVLAVMRKTDSTARNATLFAITTTAGVTTRICQFFYPWQDGVVYADYGGTTGSNRISYTYDGGTEINNVVFSAGPLGSVVAVNGVIKASQSTALTRTDGAATCAWNRLAGGASTDLIELYFGALWKRQLPFEACRQLSLNPYQLLEKAPAMRPMYVPAAAAGGSAPLFYHHRQTQGIAA